MNAAVETQVDSRNPWLGLASFTEETRAYFFGRDEEVAELSRRVQRKLLTVLFGQSGLGKTSILRAGLVPKLRSQGYCPVYVRIDYSADSPEPAEQIKHAIAQTALGSGKWTQTGVAAAGESLWEFLHHRDDVLRDDSGQTVIPLLIFDQFEEIFTLAQNDDTGRARATRFIRDLADLVENRPPREFEELLEKDETATERFDFARSDYRVLISLREDYLAPLESLKRDMPSIAQNRLRLAPMSGQQALAAVTKPGKGLVNEEVAAAIVRFVAGGSEVQNAEVEPALLSLVCRELNDARVVAGRAEISPDLLEGSQDTILSNFYERSLGDQPPAVRRVVEDQLLTTSGFRENIAEERLVAAFKAAGAAPNTLSVLVNRRLLRVEERLDLRRVELTHDVLCAVVKRSRDVRQEREAREAADRQLADQRAKEVAARKALVRARQIASICSILALVAIAAAVLAVVSTNRARRAEQATQQARVQAETLIGYLTEDFAGQLETFGQLRTISEMAKRQIDYFRGLPPSLKDADSIRNGALAMITYARAEHQQAQNPVAMTAVREANKLLEDLRANGDHSEATTIALARGYDVMASIFATDVDPAMFDTGTRAEHLIESVATGQHISPAVIKAQAEILTHLGYEEGFLETHMKDAAAHLERARVITVQLGAKGLHNLEISQLFTEAAVWEAEVLMRLGRNDEAYAIDVEAHAIALKVLESRPDYLQELHTAQVITIDLAGLAYERLDPAAGIPYGEAGQKLGLDQLRRDPAKASAHNNLSVAYQQTADIYWELGRPREALADYQRSLDLWSNSPEESSTWYILNSLGSAGVILGKYVDAGHDAEANEIKRRLYAKNDGLRKTQPAGSKVVAFATCSEHQVEASMALASNDFKTARAQAVEARRLIQSLTPDASMEGLIKFDCDFYAPILEAEAEIWSGDYAAAEAAAKYALAERSKFPDLGLDAARTNQGAAALAALAVARQGRTTEAANLVGPVVQYERDLATHNKSNIVLHFELAQALYVQSLTDKAHGPALRREALGLMDQLPAEFRRLHHVTRWRQVMQSAH